MAYHDLSRAQRRIKTAYRRAGKPLKQYLSPLVKHGHLAKETPLPPRPVYDPSTYLNGGMIAGWFRCHKCGTENTIYYRKDDHPFGFLVCINPLGCAREPGRGVVINSETEFSITVKRHRFITSDPVPVHPRIPNKLLQQIPFFAVCPNCGLTHRAAKSETELTWMQRLLYRIDDPRDTVPISYEDIEQCRCCGLRRSDSGDDKWLRFGIYYARGYYLVDEFNGYYAQP